MVTRSKPLVATVLALSIFTTPASSFTFGIAGDGSSQQLNWFWEYIQSGSFQSCMTSHCGSFILATSGRIPLQGSTFSPRYAAGGMLDWTASSGLLRAVAMPRVYSLLRTSGSMTWASAWGSIDARATPLEFVVLGEQGDPFPLNVQLLIRPRLVGSVDFFTWPNGESNLYMQMEMSVSVNGEVVSQDTLTRDYTRANGQQETYSLAHTGHGAVVNATNGTLIGISMWAYARATATGPADVYPYSPYGEGPAIEILVSDANTVAVEEEPAPAGLSLAASPNPMKHSARIAYTLPKTADVRVSIYDISGHRIARLRDGRSPAGPGEVTWGGRSDEGTLVPAGIYLVELMAGVERRVRRLAVLGTR